MDPLKTELHRFRLMIVDTTHTHTLTLPHTYTDSHTDSDTHTHKQGINSQTLKTQKTLKAVTYIHTCLNMHKTTTYRSTKKKKKEKKEHMNSSFIDSVSLLSVDKFPE